MFQGFFPDELTAKGYVQLNKYYEEEWWKMTDRRVGKHTVENHVLWVATAKEIQRAIEKRNNRAFKKEMNYPLGIKRKLNQ